jgi:hypothetical protein
LQYHPSLFVNAHHMNPERDLGGWVKRLTALKVEA